MKTHLISYDLIGHETAESYKSLITAIKDCKNWAKPLESTWLVKTELSAVQIRDILRSYLDTNDKLLVVEVASDWASISLPEKVVEWMHK